MSAVLAVQARQPESPAPAQKLGTSAPPRGDQSREGALPGAPRPASLLYTAVYRSDPVSDKAQGNNQHLNLFSALQTCMKTSTLTYTNVHTNIVHKPQKRKPVQNVGPLLQNRTRSQTKPPSNIPNISNRQKTNTPWCSGFFVYFFTFLFFSIEKFWK